MNNREFLNKKIKIKSKIKKVSGAGVDDIYKPKIWYYEHLSFTAEKHQMIRNSLSTLDDARMQENVPAEPAASLPSYDIAAGEIEKDGNDTNERSRLQEISSN